MITDNRAERRKFLKRQSGSSQLPWFFAPAMAVILCLVIRKNNHKPVQGESLSIRRLAAVSRSSDVTHPQADPQMATIPSMITPAAIPAATSRLLNESTLGQGAPPVEVPQAASSNVTFEDGETALARPGNFTNGVPDVTLDIPCFLNMIQPCGNVTLTNGEGKTFRTWFGHFEMPGLAEISAPVRDFEHVFSEVTAIGVGIAFLAWIVWCFMTHEKRRHFVDRLICILTGSRVALEEPDSDDEADEERTGGLEEKERAIFVNSGNIYRLLATLHPGVVGYKVWLGWARTAILTAFMQVYLPYQFLGQICTDWHFDGCKSPIWLVCNACTFATTFASLASLMQLFQGKCEQVIREGAVANCYLMSHDAPLPPPEPVFDPTDTLPRMPRYLQCAAVLTPFSSKPAQSSMQVADASLTYSGKKLAKMGGGLMSAVSENGMSSAQDVADIIPKPILPYWVVNLNETAWCCLSMFLDCYMALMIQCVLIMHMATFHGQLETVAIHAVALYFVFDLDDKVMHADPKLLPKYQKAVLDQTYRRWDDPRWCYSIAHLAIGFSRLLGILGMYFVVISAWQNSEDPSLIIGGDPFLSQGYGGHA